VGTTDRSGWFGSRELVVKLSDYVAGFLAGQGIRHVFAVSGGASIHLIQSLADTEGTSFICPQHEQAGAMAADTYARVTGHMSSAVSTSGPGATNMLTGVCCAYYDSVPVMYITGQVATFRLKHDAGVRQLGFQETDTVDIFRPVTKYATRIDQPERICYELGKATYLANSDRPGPVLIDIPDDLFRAQVDPDTMESFVPPVPDVQISDPLDAAIARCIRLINQAERPVVIMGWGVRLAKAEKEALALVDRLGFPVTPTWALRDLFPADHPSLVGAFGTHGTRAGNFAVQNADLVLVVGARLDTREAGTPASDFARGAKKIVVDIDPSELAKFQRLGLNVDLLIPTDAGEFLRAILLRGEALEPRDVSAWVHRVAQWKANYPVCLPEYNDELEVNPYVFVKALSDETAEGDVFVVDTGSAVAWMMQGMDFKPGQRLIHDFNNTAMGYALPGSIGASLALDKRRVICVSGDGSLQMNIQELATVIRHQLPIKIFLINNHGHSMIQQTQEQWLGGRHLASTVEGGLAFPDWVRVAEAYDFNTITIDSNAGINAGIRAALDAPGPVFCNVEISSRHRVLPQVKFGRPIEDSEPLLNREEFFANMIVSCLEVSKK
jgi:acetolactate synthase-1/2/3 large subunit